MTRSALEILGPGYVLARPLSAARQQESRAVSLVMLHLSRAEARP